MWRLINVIVASGPWDSAASGDGWALDYYGNDGSPESKDEEIARRNACATAFVGKSPLYNSVLVSAHNDIQQARIQ
jgi:hypothetical protein